MSTDPGLCAVCRHARRIETTRGSVFWLCRRSETDLRYPRYPALPVLACLGYETESGSPAKPQETPPA